MLHLVLAEAAIEPVPEALWSHPAISRHAKTRSKRPQQLLLDDTHHHQAMRWGAEQRVFQDHERRGRPDILHVCLMVAMEHRLNLAGGLRVWVHTRNDERIRIAWDTRLQRTQHRFYGLLESLFANQRLPPDESRPELLALQTGFTLKDVVAATKAERVFVFDEGGQDVHGPGALEAALDAAVSGGGGTGEEAGQKTGGARHPSEVRGPDTCFVIGAFPHGGFAADLSQVDTIPRDRGNAPRKVALGEEPLTAWSVVGEALTRYMLWRDPA